jgi:hypothetical protein
MRKHNRLRSVAVILLVVTTPVSALAVASVFMGIKFRDLDGRPFIFQWGAVTFAGIPAPWKGVVIYEHRQGLLWWPSWTWVAGKMIVYRVPLWPVLPACLGSAAIAVMPKRTGGARCRSCGYDLSSIAAPRCPECGREGAH